MNLTSRAHLIHRGGFEALSPFTLSQGVSHFDNKNSPVDTASERLRSVRTVWPVRHCPPAAPQSTPRSQSTEARPALHSPWSRFVTGLQTRSQHRRKLVATDIVRASTSASTTHYEYERTMVEFEEAS